MAGKAAFIGVDVGTGSVRAALVSIEGQIIGKSKFYVHTLCFIRNAWKFQLVGVLLNIRNDFTKQG